MTARQLTRKQPRDFIWLDEFQNAVNDWPDSYPGNKVWINIHEYKATLAGDASYLRLLISGSHNCNLVWQTKPDSAHELKRMMTSITHPLSFKSLKEMGFQFHEDDDF